MNINFELIESELLKIISADFDSVKIVKVTVVPDIDFDGDDILRVQVVFDGQSKDLNGSLMAQSIRKIRPKLRELEAFAFPSLSFVKQEDAGIPLSA